jgi:hypothetical protein
MDMVPLYARAVDDRRWVNCKQQDRMMTRNIEKMRYEV